MKTVYIYCLKDPRNNKIRYVGKTEKSLEKRLKDHVREKGKTRKINWIKSLVKLNLEPKIELLEICWEDIWEEKEIYWITYYKSIGEKLTNLTKGGKGNKGQIFSKKSNIKRSKSLIGRKHSIETKDKIRKAILGLKRSEEIKQKIREANLGKICLLEIRIKKSKPVIQMDLNDKEIEEFYSICQAQRITGCSKGAISNACKNNKTSGGFKWKYK